MPRLPVALALLAGLGFPALRLAAADEPEFNGRTLSAWRTQLREDPVPRKRRAAVVALGQLAPANKDTLAVVLQAVGKALREDASPAVREQAAGVLGQQRVAEGAAVVIPDLAEAMRAEKEPAVRREVAVTLGRFGPLAKSAVLPLTQGLRDPDPGVRAAAADALGRVGPDAKAAAADLLKLFADAAKPVRQAAVFAVGRVDPEDTTPAVVALAGVVKADPDADLRREAVVALGFLGDTSTEAVKGVAAALAEADADARRQAVLTLTKFGAGARPAEAELARAFRDDADRLVRVYAARALGAGYGASAADLIPLFAERLTGPKADPEFEVRVAVAEELGALGAAGTAAVPTLRAAQRDPQIKVREAATAALRQIQRPPTPPPAKP